MGNVLRGFGLLYVKGVLLTTPLRTNCKKRHTLWTHWGDIHYGQTLGRHALWTDTGVTYTMGTGKTLLQTGASWRSPQEEPGRAAAPHGLEEEPRRSPEKLGGGALRWSPEEEPWRSMGEEVLRSH